MKTHSKFQLFCIHRINYKQMILFFHAFFPPKGLSDTQNIKYNVLQMSKSIHYSHEKNKVKPNNNNLALFTPKFGLNVNDKWIGQIEGIPFDTVKIRDDNIIYLMVDMVCIWTTLVTQIDKN